METLASLKTIPHRTKAYLDLRTTLPTGRCLLPQGFGSKPRDAYQNKCHTHKWWTNHGYCFSPRSLRKYLIQCLLSGYEPTAPMRSAKEPILGNSGVNPVIQEVKEIHSPFYLKQVHIFFSWYH